MKKAIFFIIITLARLSAAVTLPAIFSDHAILAKRNNVPIFGTATPGEKIILTFDGKSYSIITDNKGKWEIKLDLTTSSPGPHTLKVNNLIIKDILVGEVFLASGQSNMAFSLKGAEGFPKEQKLPANTNLRFFNIAMNCSKTPAADVKGKWQIVTPKTMGKCSAVAYFFAKKLHQELSCPVGVINSSVGGTRIECWMRPEAIAPFKDSVKDGKRRDSLYESYSQRYAKFLTANRAWEKKYHRIDDITVLPPKEACWKQVTPPVIFGNGIYFLRTKINVSPTVAANGFRINLMRCLSPIQLYIDGKLIASKTDDTAYKMEPFIPSIPKDTLTPGTHELMLRYFVSHNQIQLPSIVYAGNQPITDKKWEIFCAKDFGIPNSTCAKERPQQPGMLPSYNNLYYRLYNGMIHPIMSYRFSGIIWYQGESNEKNAVAYRKLFPAFITDMRKQANDSKLPFFFCQLAAFREKSTKPETKDYWPLLRDAQKNALKLPATGMAVLTDAGEALDVHPIDKKTPGERMAVQALKLIYGRNIPEKGPEAICAFVKGNTVSVKFTSCYNGLTIKDLPEFYHIRRSRNQKARLIRNSPNAQVEGFALSGNDGKWYWADKAEISGDCVNVSSFKVPTPVKIRFGWMDNPTVNLYNGAGFPAVPFEFTVKQQK